MEGMSGPVAKAVAASNAKPECEKDEAMPYNHATLISDIQRCHVSAK